MPRYMERISAAMGIGKYLKNDVAIICLQIFFLFILLANNKAENKVRIVNSSAYSQFFVHVLVNFQLSFLGSCSVIFEHIE